MKRDKELIADIVDRLKSIENYPYREGAWENFKQKKPISSTGGISINKYLAIAAMLIAGLVISYYSYNNKVTIHKDLEQNNSLIVTQENTKGALLEDVPVGNIEADNYDTIIRSSTLIGASEQKNTNLPGLDYIDNDLQLNVTVDLSHILPLKPTLGQFNPPAIVVQEDLDKVQLSNDLADHLILANSSLAQTILSNSNHEKSLSPKRFKFSEKFDLGLFISPFTNSENLRVGGGLALAYNINNKISIRTGASYNTYEVGLLKNPLAASSVEQVEVGMLNSNLQSPGSGNDLLSVSKLAIPNINAVSGFVQSVEIPLEVKYTLNNSFYAAAGVSYSTIVSQERNAQYVENVNLNTFNDGFPANEQEASKALKMVTKTVKSAEQNVNTAGYNGFINLSIGKKMKVNSKFGVAIEPYYKIPVGEFRKADMNYSNGGVRIMTNF